MSYAKEKNLGTERQTVSLDKPCFSDVNQPFSGLPVDLAEIADLWQQLPDHVRVGILAMIRVF
jgi:hypothetical protein